MNRKTGYIWIPCDGEAEVARANYRGALRHELKEWLQHWVAKGTNVTMPGAHDKKVDFWEAVRSLSAQEGQALSARLTQLSAGQNWE